MRTLATRWSLCYVLLGVAACGGNAGLKVPGDGGSDALIEPPASGGAVGAGGAGGINTAGPDSSRGSGGTEVPDATLGTGGVGGPDSGLGKDVLSATDVADVPLGETWAPADVRIALDTGRPIDAAATLDTGAPEARGFDAAREVGGTGGAGAGGDRGNGGSGAGGCSCLGGSTGTSVPNWDPVGTNWRWRGSDSPGPQNWFAVTSSADGTKLVAAAQDGYLFTSADSGLNWTQRATSQSWSGVASSADGAKLVAVSSDGPIYTSSDSGVTWVERSSGLGSWGSVASSADGSRLVAGAWNGYIYTSPDAGATWRKSDAPLAWWFSVASSADGNKLVAVQGISSDAVAATGHIYTSVDAGATWMLRGSDLGSQSWLSVASSANGALLVAAKSSGQVCRSTDAGTTWTEYGPAATYVASSADGSKLVAVGTAIFTSTDSGASWAGLHTDSMPWRAVASSADGSKLVAVAQRGYIYTFTATP